MGLLKNYNASKQATRIAPDTKAVKLMKIGGEKKTRKTKKKGEPYCYHCSVTHYWAYGCPNILEAKREKMRTTKEKVGHVHAQVSEVVEDKIICKEAYSK